MAKRQKLSKLAKAKANPKSNYWRNQADKLWASTIRAVGSCEICGKTEDLQAAHLIPREIKATRHDVYNGLCLCAKCHKWGMSSIHRNPAKTFCWLRQNKPRQFDWLNHNVHNVSTEAVDYKEAYWQLLPISTLNMNKYTSFTVKRETE